ncbi:MAG: hypothetical protein KBG09_06155 [Syntrophobacterales bacterium]|nr:hypothetical protein [Syntrophobacterales bacterium]
MILVITRWAAIYFAIVFGVGFVLGPIRVLWLEPRLGVRLAELIEAPFMCLAIILAGRWVGQSLRSRSGEAAMLGVGALAAGLVLAADVFVGVGIRSMSVVEVFVTRDPISGAVYYALVGFTAVAPWLFGRNAGAGEHERD